MHEVCTAAGLRQIVREPTRGDNLLDLVITDIHGASARVRGKVQDHNIDLASVAQTIPVTKIINREVWTYAKGDRARLKDLLANES